MTITPADVETIRRFYAAVDARDFATMESCFTPHAVWHLPGRGAVAGDHRGWPAIRDDFLTRLAPLSGGTFRVEVVDLALGADCVVAIQHATADHRGRHLDVTACQVMRMEGGRIAEVQGHYSDLYAMDAFWQDD